MHVLLQKRKFEANSAQFFDLMWVLIAVTMYEYKPPNQDNQGLTTANTLWAKGGKYLYNKLEPNSGTVKGMCIIKIRAINDDLIVVEMNLHRSQGSRDKVTI